MEIYIDIITGFLESGKTTFIKDLISSRFLEEYENIVLIVCEEGFTEYDEDYLEKLNIRKIVLEDENELNDNLFAEISKQYKPDYVIVEYNGTWNISKILGLKLPSEYMFCNVISVSEAKTFRSNLSNMTSIIQPHVLNSDTVVFNRYEEINSEMKKKLIQDVKNINPRTKVTFLKEVETDKVLKEQFIEFGSKGNLIYIFRMNLKIILFSAIVFSLGVALTFESVNSYIQAIVTVFLSILMQAVPFILLGAFISAGIQIFTSTGWIMKQISKGSWGSFLIASIAGFFLPICDCGMVPIISGLLKKDTPLPQTITFWLTSSAVSPIVILSMLYAFPQQPYMVVIRAGAGIAVGIIAGIILKVMHLETKEVTKENRRVQNIGKDILELKYEGTKGKFEAVFAGAMIEFFRVCEYVIIGALISAFLQTIMPQTMKAFINNNIIIQFMVMVVAAMFMSTCSTSNAFIGRSFSSNFSLVPILSFIVMGPMIDLKNMVMLSEILKKRFLVFLSFMVIIESAIVFGALSFFV